MSVDMWRLAAPFSPFVISFVLIPTFVIMLPIKSAVTKSMHLSDLLSAPLPPCYEKVSACAFRANLKPILDGGLCILTQKAEVLCELASATSTCLRPKQSNFSRDRVVQFVNDLSPSLLLNCVNSSSAIAPCSITTRTALYGIGAFMISL